VSGASWSHGRRTVRTVMLTIIVATLLSGCSSPAPEADQTPTPAAASDPSTDMTPSGELTCGQVASLIGIAHRAQFNADSAAISPAELAAVYHALGEAWQYMPVEPGPIYEAAGEVRVLAAASGRGFDPQGTEVAAAIANVSAACTAAGVEMVIGAGPGQGG
jgi:uncharacterized protein YceK